MLVDGESACVAGSIGSLVLAANTTAGGGTPASLVMSVSVSGLVVLSVPASGVSATSLTIVRPVVVGSCAIVIGGFHSHSGVVPGLPVGPAGGLSTRTMNAVLTVGTVVVSAD